MNTVSEKSIDKKEMRLKIQNFADTCRKFYQRELKIPEYKSISGDFGTYSERNHKTGMLRLRIPAGDLSLENLKFIIDSIKKYDIKKIHITLINQFSYTI